MAIDQIELGKRLKQGRAELLRRLDADSRRRIRQPVFRPRYRDHPGVALVPSNCEEPGWRQEAGPTAFAPFPETTDYFGPDAAETWMVNFRVRSLDAMLAQLRAAGVAVEVDPQPYPNGRLARLYDPEGSAFELWEPAGRDAQS